jgi:hypothetical protein
VLRTLALGKRAREDGANELCLGKRVALLRLHGEAIVRGGKPALERDVLRCDCRMAAKEVPEGEVVALLPGPGDAEMNMVGARPFGWLLEEGAHEIERAEGEVRLAQVSQPCAVAIRGLKGRDGDLDVDDWLGRETGNGSRSDMPKFEAHGLPVLGGCVPLPPQTSPASRDRKGR